jgi:hypothetical protein
MSQLTGSYGFAVSGNLRLAPSDQGSPTTYTWANAKTQCADLTTDGKTWRLPNIAELGNLQSTRTSYNMAYYNYWSSTENSSTTAWVWLYYSSDTGYHYKTNNYYVRCVRSL